MFPAIFHLYIFHQNGLKDERPYFLMKCFAEPKKKSMFTVNFLLKKIFRENLNEAISLAEIGLPRKIFP